MKDAKGSTAGVEGIGKQTRASRKWLTALSTAALILTALACGALEMGVEPTSPVTSAPPAASETPAAPSPTTPADPSPTAPVEFSTPVPPAVPSPFPVTVVATPPTAVGDTEALVLKQVGERIPMCPTFAYDRNTLFISADESPSRFGLSCGVGWGHVSNVRIWRYNSALDAQSAFADICEDQPVQSFHGHPAIEWQCFTRSYANCTPSSELERGMLHRNHCWQADRWVICAHAFDDTSIEIAADPLEISEAVYQSSVEHGLFHDQ